MVAWAFSIAASAFFPALIMGIFWKRANRQGAIAGMLSVNQVYGGDLAGV